MISQVPAGERSHACLVHPFRHFKITPSFVISFDSFTHTAEQRLRHKQRDLQQLSVMQNQVPQHQGLTRFSRLS